MDQINVRTKLLRYLTYYNNEAVTTLLTHHRMAYPPERITVKRPRDEDPVDALCKSLQHIQVLLLTFSFSH